MESYSDVIEIRDKLTKTIIDLKSCSINEIVAKYSNTKLPIYKLVIANKCISRNNTYVVKFICKNCSLQREITLNLYLRRIQKNTKNCYLCVNKDTTKRESHSIFMKENICNIKDKTYITSHERIKDKTLEEHIEYSIAEWEKEDIEFVNNYNLIHLSLEEFSRILPKIKGISNNKITNYDDWVYFPQYRIFNQTRYTPMLINTKESLVEKPLYISFECENCQSLFTHRDLEIVKNKLKIFCQECTLTNKTFKLRSLTLKDGNKILWQSIPERRFIEWCEENSIPIKNGPVIEYVLNNSKHKYRVDFELIKHNKLIEIKDNHCWHKQQLASGKFGAKEQAANEWCSKNNYTFHIIFPKNLQTFKDSIIL